MKKTFIVFCLFYSLASLLLLSIHFSDDLTSRAVILMGLILFLVWIILGGSIQLWYLKIKSLALKPGVCTFSFLAIILACIEEAIAVTITNLAPLLGVKVGEAYITASTNYFDVIFFHSVVVFIPMLITLGLILKKYDLSPFLAFLLWGTVGVIGEYLFTGSPMVFLNAPMWICIYGLMVYLPSHIFINTKRQKISPFLLPFYFPIFMFLILISASLTAWIPAVLDHPSIHFPNI